MAQPRTIGTAIMGELPTGEKFLIVQFEIACDVCGPAKFQVAGHHLRAIRNFITQVIDEFPDLTLREEDIKTLEHLKFSVQVPPNPEDN